MGVRSLNRVMLIGNVTHKPICGRTKKDYPVCTIFVVTDREWYSGGEKKTETVSHECVCWGEIAEFVDLNLKKGDFILIEGYLTGDKIEHGNRTDIVKGDKVTAEKLVVLKHSTNQDQETLASPDFTK